MYIHTYKINIYIYIYIYISVSVCPCVCVNCKNNFISEKNAQYPTGMFVSFPVCLFYFILYFYLYEFVLPGLKFASSKYLCI